jgi:dolichyl-phosphate-mannose--protein O-mannosyl transferase
LSAVALWAAVGVLGGLGALARFLLDARVSASAGARFPFGTLLVNLSGAILLGVLAGWLPWIWYAWHDNRTEFFYYAVAFEPFMIIAIVLCLGLIIGPTRAAPGRRALGAVAAGGYLVAVLLNLAYLYPVLTAEVIPYGSWLSRMWFHRWI